MLEKNLPESSKLTFKHTFFEEVSNENWVCHTIDMGPEPEDYTNEIRTKKDWYKKGNSFWKGEHNDKGEPNGRIIII